MTFFNKFWRSESTALGQSFRRLCKAEGGAVATEFALVLPIYLMVIILIVELARVVYVQAAVTFAAEEATRYALVRYDATTADIEAFASNSLLALSADQVISIVVEGTLNTDATRLISVTITYQYEPILPVHKFFSGISQSGFELSGISKGFLTEETVVG